MVVETNRETRKFWGWEVAGERNTAMQSLGETRRRDAGCQALRRDLITKA